MGVKRTNEQRFWSYVSRTDGCWDWTGAKASGYGRIYWDGQVTAAHRIAYELFIGPIPTGLQLDHLCRNRACVNPSHLEAVTGRVNLLRGEGMSAINAAHTHCPQGHAFTVANTYLWRNARHCRTCRTAISQRRSAKKAATHRVIEGVCVFCRAAFTHTRGKHVAFCSDACRKDMGRKRSRELGQRKRDEAKNRPR